MTDSPTSRLGLRAQETGGNTNTWGELLNAALQLIDDAIAGMATVALTGDYALSRANFVEDEARKALLKFTGTGNFTVTIPSVSKPYIVWNACTGTVTITTGAGSTVAVDTGDIVFVFCDGSNVKTFSYGGLSIKDYVTAQTASAGAVPGNTGHAGKFLATDGTNNTWQQISITDIDDYASVILGVQVALAVAL